MRIALDSNVLVYFAGIDRNEGDPTKIELTWELIERLRGRTTLVVPTQALGEVFVVLRRAGTSANAAREIVTRFSTDYLAVPTRQATFLAALALAVDHRFQLWDSIIVTTAIEADCTMLLSEDMQDGFVTRGMTIVNPYAKAVHPALATLLAD